MCFTASALFGCLINMQGGSVVTFFTLESKFGFSGCNFDVRVIPRAYAAALLVARQLGLFPELSVVVKCHIAALLVLAWIIFCIEL